MTNHNIIREAFGRAAKENPNSEFALLVNGAKEKAKEEETIINAQRKEIYKVLEEMQLKEKITFKLADEVRKRIDKWNEKDKKDYFNNEGQIKEAARQIIEERKKQGPEKRNPEEERQSLITKILEEISSLELEEDIKKLFLKKLGDEQENKEYENERSSLLKEQRKKLTDLRIEVIQKLQDIIHKNTENLGSAAKELLIRLDKEVGDRFKITLTKDDQNKNKNKESKKIFPYTIWTHDGKIILITGNGTIGKEVTIEIIKKNINENNVSFIAEIVLEKKEPLKMGQKLEVTLQENQKEKGTPFVSKAPDGKNILIIEKKGEIGKRKIEEKATIEITKISDTYYVAKIVKKTEPGQKKEKPMTLEEIPKETIEQINKEIKKIEKEIQKSTVILSVFEGVKTFDVKTEIENTKNTKIANEGKLKELKKKLKKLNELALKKQ